ncbi:MAG: NAD-dependent protein deacylase [Syntrophus sp. (in: bacteria)]|nr:NAD-dependent protein deacylase [Syntrophus sp. (in: bacteria)]
MDRQIERIARWIVEAKTVVIFTGAGLSTESGIPDFRSPGGVWDKYNPEDFYFDHFIASEISRWKYWQMSTEMYEPMKEAQPNAAHIAIAELEKMGRLDCVITQNIDNLHVRAGSSPEKVIELHGTAMSVSCLDCRKKFDREEVQKKLKKEMKVPYCDSCGGPLKPDTISFGQAMPARETQEAYSRSSASDLFIVIGSSLVVQPAASMPVTAKRNGARLVIINRDPTPCDSMADIVIHDLAGPTMTALLNGVKRIAPG